MMKKTNKPIGGQPRFGKFLPGQRKPLMAMIEITNRCNLSCPVCFSNAHDSAQDISVAKVHTYLEQSVTNTQRLFGRPNGSTHVKNAFHHHVVDGKRNVVQ